MAKKITPKKAAKKTAKKAAKKAKTSKEVLIRKNGDVMSVKISNMDVVEISGAIQVLSRALTDILMEGPDAIICSKEEKNGKTGSK
jgi:hypothetical protein